MMPLLLYSEINHIFLVINQHLDSYIALKHSESFDLSMTTNFFLKRTYFWFSFFICYTY